MILTKITLTIEDKQFDILHFNYYFCRDTDTKGRPCSRYYGGMLFIEMESLPENYLMSRLVSFEQMLVSGKIEVWAKGGEQCIRRIEFEKAYICHHQEEMNSYQPLPMLTTISISPLRLDINKKVRIDRRISDTNNGCWDKYVPPKEEKSKQEKEEIYVKYVEGKSSATVGDEVTYTVKEYTSNNVSEDDRHNVRWTMKVDKMETKLSGNGETMKIKMKPEWAGKEIIVMPYLHSSTERVSVKTKVNLKDGVFLWVETQGTGHTFVSLHYNNRLYVYTYGRFDDVDWKQTTGEGVLIRYINDINAISYITNALYRLNASVYEIKDINPQIVMNNLDSLYNSSNVYANNIATKEIIKKYGKIVDEYSVISNNCTTLSCKILIKSGTHIFDDSSFWGLIHYKQEFVIPSSLKLYLMNNSFSKKNPNVKQDMKKMYSQNTHNILQKGGIGGETSGSLGDIGGASANSDNNINPSSGSRIK